MNNENVMQMLSEAGAVITNSHIVYTSGRHGKTYINKDALYVHTHATSELCKLMADFYDAGQIDVVAGPTIGGVVLSQWVAFHLTAKRSSGETLAVYAEKEEIGDDKKMIFKRGYDQLLAGKNILVVEDILTTGGSARKVIDAVRNLNGKVISLSVLCNRGGIKTTDIGNVPIQALVELDLESWAESDCPLCLASVPINTDVGKGRSFLSKRRVGV